MQRGAASRAIVRKSQPKWRERTKRKKVENSYCVGQAWQLNNLPITKQPALSSTPLRNRLPLTFTVAFSGALEARTSARVDQGIERKNKSFLLFLDAIVKNLADVGEVSDALQPCSIARVVAPEMTSSDCKSERGCGTEERKRGC